MLHFQSKHKVLRGYVGDRAANLRLKLFTDADLAGDRPSYRSTTDVILVLWGPNTFFPLAAMSKRQSSVSHSTPEAEVVAASIGIRVIGLPQLDLWDTITKRSMSIDHAEDNQTAISVMKVGVSATMRHISWTHGVCLAWLAEVVQQKLFNLYHEDTEWISADIFTKAITKIPAWEHALRLIGIVDAASTTTRSLEHEKKLSLSLHPRLTPVNTVLSCACISSKSTSLLSPSQPLYRHVSTSSSSSCSDSSFDSLSLGCERTLFCCDSQALL